MKRAAAILLATTVAALDAGAASVESACSAPVAVPLFDDSAPPFTDSKGKQVTYNGLVASLLSTANEAVKAVKIVQCPDSNDDCLVVSMFTCSDPVRAKCNAKATPSHEARCQATDELSQ